MKFVELPLLLLFIFILELLILNNYLYFFMFLFKSCMRSIIYHIYNSIFKKFAFFDHLKPKFLYKFGSQSSNIVILVIFGFKI